MKKPIKLFILSLFLLSITTGFSQNKTDASDAAPHGGQIRQSGQYTIEFLFSSVSSFVYLYNPDLQPLGNTGISGKLIFKLADSTITAIDLKPYLDYGFTAITNIPAYNSCTVLMDIKGKPVSSEFEYLESIAEQKK